MPCGKDPEDALPMKLKKTRGLGYVPRSFPLPRDEANKLGLLTHTSHTPWTTKPRPRNVPAFLYRGQVGKASWGATGITLRGKLVCFRVDKTPKVYSVPKMKRNLPSSLAVPKHKGLGVLLSRSL